MLNIYSLSRTILFTKKKSSKHAHYYQRIKSHEKSKSFFCQFKFPFLFLFPNYFEGHTWRPILYPRDLCEFSNFKMSKMAQKNYDIMDGKIIWHTWLLFSNNFLEMCTILRVDVHLVHAGRYLCVVKLC